MPRPSGEDVATHYGAAHARLAAIAADLDGARTAVPVPATPGWTVHDVYSHLAAIAVAVAAGRWAGVPGDEETARQVAAGRGRPVADVVAGWSAAVPAVVDAARAGEVSANVAVDAVTHEQDVRGALGLARLPDPDAVRFATARYAAGAARRVAAAGLAPLGIVAVDTGERYGAPDHDAGVVLAASTFELFRVLSGRRSRRQGAQYVWTGDGIGPYLDVLNVFGALPRDDVDDDGVWPDSRV